uniref:Uncharacterized protein n=1 Tax=Anguilla anguilla TaxID=7936 RepID=A0A0E9WL51_ANGAN
MTLEHLCRATVALLDIFGNLECRHQVVCSAAILYKLLLSSPGRFVIDGSLQ